MASAHYHTSAVKFLSTVIEDDVLLIVRPVAADVPEGMEPVDEIALLGAPEGVGTNSLAYLVYGIPGSSNYAFFDMNNLPEGYSAELTLSSGDVVHSKSRWEGKSGNAPQPTDNA